MRELHDRYFTVALTGAEAELLSALAQRLERRRGDAIRFVLRWAYQELQSGGKLHRREIKPSRAPQQGDAVAA